MARTTALNKIEATLYEPTFYKVIQGGQGAGKTYAIMTLLIGYCDSYRDSKVTVVGMTYSHLKDGAISDFKSILQEVGRWDEDKWNRTELTYHFPNGSDIQFRSVDKLTGRGPRRDVVYVNEADAITWETFEHVSGRSRDFAIIDYNPVSKFWAHEKLIEHPPKTGVSFITLTYKDNEALPEQERLTIESHKPKKGEQPSNWWTVYGLGQIGVLEGNIYSGWVESTPKDIKESGKLIRYGLDFGFGHPTGLISLWERPDGSLGVIEEIYKSGMRPSDYVPALKNCGIDPSELIIADSARPEIIAEIKRAGYRIIGANKDAGSVERGILRVQERQIYFYGKNLKAEYLAYHWRTKRSTGETIYEPEKSDDDLMDALRYAIDDLGRKRFDF